MILRAIVPGLLAIAGTVFFVLGGEFNGAMGVMLWGTALVIWIFVGLIALSARSTHDRHAEEAARDEFTRTGRWPYDPEAD